MSTGREIHLIEEEDGWWSAVDEQTGVASQGPTRTAALEDLDEAVERTEEARDDEAAAPEPDAPWIERWSHGIFLARKSSISSERLAIDTIAHGVTTRF